MTKFDIRKLNIKRELHNSIDRSKFLGNTVLAGYIATGIYTGLNPQENFSAGVISTILLTGGLIAEKNLSQMKADSLINQYENISHSNSEPISQKLLPQSERSTQPRKLSLSGIAESVKFAGIFGGVSEAGAFLLVDSESTSRAFSLGLGAVALTGAAVFNYAFNKVLAEDLNFRTDMETMKIDDFYTQTNL